jgi:hypothetical protein
MGWIKQGLIWMRERDKGEDNLVRQQGILTLVTWHDVTGGNATPGRLRELASRMTVDSLVLLASSFSTILANRRQVSVKSKVDDQISGALEMLPSPIKDSVVRMLKAGSHHVWFHDEQLLVAAKLAVLYGRDGPPAWDKAVGAELLLGINDIVGSAEPAVETSDKEEERRLLGFIIRRLGLLQNEAPRYLIGRYYDLLVTRADKYQGLLQQNVNEAFLAATGIGIEEFFAFALVFAAVFSQFSTAQKLGEANFAGIGIEVEASIKDNQVRGKVSEALATDRAGLQERFAGEAESPQIARSQLLPFQEKPLYRLSSGSLVPLIYPFLLDKASLGIYWILQNYFAGIDTQHGVESLRSMLGRLHQDYVTDILARTYRGRAGATVHSEADLVGAQPPPPRNNEGLPDALLTEGEDAVVFEMSVTALTYGLLLTGDQDRFENETAEKFRPKFSQLAHSIDALVDAPSSFPGLGLDGIRHIYPVLVLLFPFPQQVLTWRLFDGVINVGPRQSQDGSRHIEIHPPQIITDEELEMLEPHIAARGLSLSKLLRRKTASLASRWISMKNFLFLFERLPDLENPAMHELYSTATERGKAILRSELRLG